MANEGNNGELCNMAIDRVLIGTVDRLAVGIRLCIDEWRNSVESETVNIKQLGSIICGRRTNFSWANASWTYYPNGDPMGKPTNTDAAKEWDRLNAIFQEALEKYPYSKFALHYLWNTAIATGPDSFKQPPAPPLTNGEGNTQ